MQSPANYKKLNQLFSLHSFITSCILLQIPMPRKVLQSCISTKNLHVHFIACISPSNDKLKHALVSYFYVVLLSEIGPSSSNGDSPITYEIYFHWPRISVLIPNHHVFIQSYVKCLYQSSLKTLHSKKQYHENSVISHISRERYTRLHFHAP